jgi:hypothetical protein
MADETFSVAERFLNGDLDAEGLLNLLRARSLPNLCDLVLWLRRYTGNKARQGELVHCYMQAGATHNPRGGKNVLLFVLRYYPEPVVVNALLNNRMSFKGADPYEAVIEISHCPPQTFAVLKQHWPFLLSEGLDVNAGQRGGSYMHYRFHDPANVRRLLDMGCDPNCLDARGRTPEQAMTDMYKNYRDTMKEIHESAAIAREHCIRMHVGDMGVYRYMSNREVGGRR